METQNLENWIYAISSIKKRYIYVGFTKDLERRLQEHNNGWVKTTRVYRPFRTILVERIGSRTEARKREKYLKSGIGKEYLKKL